MRIFGKLWDAPVCDDAEPAPTPIGSSCPMCEEAVQEGDRGLLVPHLGAEGGVSEKAHHAECWLYSIAGDTIFTPKAYPSFTPTYRQRAREAWRLAMGPRENATADDPSGLVLATLTADTTTRRAEVHQKGCPGTPVSRGWSSTSASEIRIAETIEVAKISGMSVATACQQCTAWPYG